MVFGIWLEFGKLHPELRRSGQLEADLESSCMRGYYSVVAFSYFKGIFKYGDSFTYSTTVIEDLLHASHCY